MMTITRAVDAADAEQQVRMRAEVVGGCLGDLDTAGLRREQLRTLASPRRRYSIAAKVLFRSLDLVYGRKRTLVKFRVLELIARVPYQAWEQAGYVAITHTFARVGFARRIFDRVRECRGQQDNEQWHLLILEELLLEDTESPNIGWLRSWLIPQLVAFAYYQLSFLLYVTSPAWSYRLNADFEDHAEHEYMELVAEHPEWETVPWSSAFTADYGSFASRADLLRQIGYDERVHKEESEHAIGEARFR
jgi:ubiquinol oxidase